VDGLARGLLQWNLQHLESRLAHLVVCVDMSTSLVSHICMSLSVIVCHCLPSGQSGWGIAYFVDGMLAPVLRLRRNVTYTFIVEAGNNATDGPNYHPFYITDSIDGGILLDTPEQRAVSTN